MVVLYHLVAPISSESVVLSSSLLRYLEISYPMTSWVDPEQYRSISDRSMYTTRQMRTDSSTKSKRCSLESDNLLLTDSSI